MLLSYSLLLFLLSTSAVAAPVHEEVTLTPRGKSASPRMMPLAEAAVKLLHGGIYGQTPIGPIWSAVLLVLKTMLICHLFHPKQEPPTLVNWRVHILMLINVPSTISHGSTGTGGI